MSKSKNYSTSDDTPKNQKSLKIKNAPGSPRIDEQVGGGVKIPPETESGQDAAEILEETVDQAAAEPVNRLAGGTDPADAAGRNVPGGGTPSGDDGGAGPVVDTAVNRLAGGTGPADAESTAGTGEILEKSETPAASAGVVDSGKKDVPIGRSVTLTP